MTENSLMGLDTYPSMPLARQHFLVEVSSLRKVHTSDARS